MESRFTTKEEEEKVQGNCFVKNKGNLRSIFNQNSFTWVCNLHFAFKKKKRLNLNGIFFQGSLSMFYSRLLLMSAFFIFYCFPRASVTLTCWWHMLKLNQKKTTRKTTRNKCFYNKKLQALLWHTNQIVLKRSFSHELFPPCQTAPEFGFTDKKHKKGRARREIHAVKWADSVGFPCCSGVMI